MNLKINDYQMPAQVGFNYEELKAELQAKVAQYETLVYTDDQIKEAKKDKAELNRLEKALNAERIRMQKEYMKPFDEFTAKINELRGIIARPVALIDKQVKEYEELQKAKKKEEIEAYFNELTFPEWVTLDRIFNKTWVNASVSMKSVKGALEVLLEGIERDLATLSSLPEFGFEAIEEYKRSMDLSRAISEGQRLADIAKRKAEQERMRALAEERKKLEEEALQAVMATQEEPVIEQPTGFVPLVESEQEEFIPVFDTPVKKEYTIKMKLFDSDKSMLKQWLDTYGIEYEFI